MSAPGELPRRRVAVAVLVLAWIAVLAAVAAGVLAIAFAPPPARVAESESARFALPPPKTTEPAAEPGVEAAPASEGAPAADADALGRPRAAGPESAAAQAPPAARTAPGPEPAPETEREPAPETEPEPAPETAAEPSAAAEVSEAPAAPEPREDDEGARPGEAQTAMIPAERPAWRRYARPAEPAPGRPRIAVVVAGLGLSSAATEAAIGRLPAAVTLSFSPYGKALGERMARARAAGHEVMIDLPMEPGQYPQHDPGPQALMVGLEPSDNLERLAWLLGRGEGYVGVAAVMGSRFAARPAVLEPVLRALAERGLVYLDNGAAGEAPARLARSLGLPHAVSARTLDAGQVSRPAIDARLVEIERVAEVEGTAVALAHPYPATLDRLAAWIGGLDGRGLALVPLTAVAESNLRAAEAAVR